MLAGGPTERAPRSAAGSRSGHARAWRPTSATRARAEGASQADAAFMGGPNDGAGQGMAHSMSAWDVQANGNASQDKHLDRHPFSLREMQYNAAASGKVRASRAGAFGCARPAHDLSCATALLGADGHTTADCAGRRGFARVFTLSPDSWVSRHGQERGPPALKPEFRFSTRCGRGRGVKSACAWNRRTGMC